MKQQKKREEQNKKIQELREKEGTEGTPEWTARQERLARLENERINKLWNDPETKRLKLEYISDQHKFLIYKTQSWKKFFTPRT